MMKVYLVAGSNQDMYREMGHDWIVGVFSSKKLAEIAIENDKDRYQRSGEPNKSSLGYSTTEIIIDQHSYQLF